MMAFAEDVSCNKVILQHRHSWTDVPLEHDKVEYLFDRSGGRGESSFHLWPAPPEKLTYEFSDERFGYAGGIGPTTIERACVFLRRYPKHRMWIDMEGRVRKNGWFDLDAVETVLAASSDTQ